jgi:hypothetical protein
MQRPNTVKLCERASSASFKFDHGFGVMKEKLPVGFGMGRWVIDLPNSFHHFLRNKLANSLT